MARSEKSAQKSKRDKSLQKTKPEPAYKSAEFIEDSSSASEAPTPSKKGKAAGRLSKTVSTPSTSGNLQNGSATKAGKHREHKKDDQSGTVTSRTHRVEKQEVIQKLANHEKTIVNGLVSTQEDSGGSEEASLPQPKPNRKAPEGEEGRNSAVETAAPPAKLPVTEASTSGSMKSSDSEEEEIDLRHATAVDDQEDHAESGDKDDEVEYQGGNIGAPSEVGESDESSESGDAPSSSGENSISRPPPAPSAHPQRPIPAYQAPPDFEPATISLEDAPNGHNLFSPGGLVGKELWHITLPSSVPVSTLKEMPLQSILDGSSILSYDDLDYGLVPHRESNARSLLIPSQPDNLYIPAKTAFTQTLRLQQLIKLPTHAVSPQLRTPSSEVPGKKRNQQPEGLRMRYQPFGIPDSSGTDHSKHSGTSSGQGENDVLAKTHSTEAPQFKPPPEPFIEDSAPKKEKKKRKHGEIASSTPATPSSSQLKKVKQEHAAPLTTISPPIQSPALVSTPITQPRNSQPIMQAKPEDLITITDASPMQVDQETMSGPPTNPSPSRSHRHKLQSPLPATPAQPKHDVLSSSNKGTNNKSHHKARKSEEKHRNRLLQPFQIPRSLSPAQTPAKNTFPNGTTPTAADENIAGHLDALVADQGVNFANTIGIGDSQTAAGASSQGDPQAPKTKKTLKPSAADQQLSSLPDEPASDSGRVKVRDFVKASDVHIGGDFGTAATPKLTSNVTTVETPSTSANSVKGSKEKTLKSEASGQAMDASSPTHANTTEDVIMQDIDSKPTGLPVDDAAERERKKRMNKARKEARKEAKRKLKDNPTQGNGAGQGLDDHPTPLSNAAKDAMVDIEPTMQKDSQLYEETERARKVHLNKEGKQANNTAPAQNGGTPAKISKSPPVVAANQSVTDEKLVGLTSSQLYEESESARKKREKKDRKQKAAQVNHARGATLNAASPALVASKDATPNEQTAMQAETQLYQETERARKKRAKKERKEGTIQASAANEATHPSAPTPTSAGQDTTAGQDATAGLTTSQIYEEGERARKKREKQQAKKESSSIPPTKPAETPAQPSASPPLAAAETSLARDSPPHHEGDSQLRDQGGERARRKREKQARKQARKDSKRKQNAVNAPAAATSGGGAT